MIKSEAINELATALAKAQGQIKPALKDSSNPFFKSNYADLASVWEACRKPLSDNGLSVIQTLDEKEAETLLETTLLHSSGQFITSALKIMPKDETSQAIGSAITYARRYALSAMVGVCADEDDDGETSMGRGKTKPTAQPAKPAPEVSTTIKEVKTPQQGKQVAGSPTVDPTRTEKSVTTEDHGITDKTLNPINTWGQRHPELKDAINAYMAKEFKRLKTADLTEPEGQQLLEALKSGKIKEAKENGCTIKENPGIKVITGIISSSPSPKSAR